MANVLEMLNVKNNVSRSGFDLTRNLKNTSQAGMIIPIHVQPVMPTDRFEFDLSHFTRTIPPASAPMADVIEEINAFYVPWHLLYSRFDTQIVQMKNNPQHASYLGYIQGAYTGFDITVNEYTPYFSRKEIAEFVYYLATQYISNSVGSETLSAVSLDEARQPAASSTCRLLSCLGYGDFTKFLKVNPASLKWSVSSISDVSMDNSYIDVDDIELDVALSAGPLLAYQKIYYDYFRNQQWEPSRPLAFNCDYLNGTSSQKISIKQLLFGSGDFSIINNLTYPKFLSTYLNCPLALRYANFPKDYFFGVRPSPQYGNSSVIPVFDTGISLPDVDVSSGSLLGSTIKGWFSSFISNPTVVSLRQSEALQKLKEIQVSGKQDYKEQIEKIFGGDMPDNMSDLCTWLGGYQSRINFSEVVNTNLSSETDYANIQGKGIGNGNGKIVFDASKFGADFGFIIVTSVVRPRVSFSFPAVEYFNNMVHVDAYPNPVLDKIGMEVVKGQDFLGYQQITMNADNLFAPDGKLTVPPSIWFNKPFGYAPRYWKHKTSYDKVLGGFNNDAFSAWCTRFTASRLLSCIYWDDTNAIPNASNSSPLMFNFLAFKITPDYLDSILTVESGFTPRELVNNDSSLPKPTVEQSTSFVGFSNIYERDQFITNFDLQCASVRPLDYDGLPY